MRHNKSFNHLSRQSAHRGSMLANMTISLILHKRINTTLAKAKALRVYAEPLINRAKEDTMANRRLVFSYLQNKEAVKILFQEVAEKIADRKGGYTRILKTGNRLGDNAKMCFIELVDYNEAMLKDKDEAKAKAKTRRGGKKKAAVENPVAEAAAAEPELPAAE
ncbi:MAG: 50S ribosomal protein L17 [Muribaculaceae bacterium]|nr:50S ribosomal protein L17 [Muribaculaceae bacterium]